MPSRRAALLPALLVLLLIPPTACAAPEWVAPVNFSVPGSDTFEGKPTAQDQVVYQDGGVLDEAFLQIGSVAPLQTTLHIGTMPPGGSYSDQLTIASSEGAYPISAQIAVAPDGAAVAAWAELTGPSLETSPYRYRAAYRPASSATWEAPFTIAVNTERKKGIFEYLTPAIGANGAAAVGVQHIASGELGASQGEPVYRIDVAVHPPAGAWSVQRISPTDESAEGLGLGFDADGNLTAAYAQRFSEGSTPAPEDDRYTLIVRRRPAASGVWGPEENITGSEIQWTVDAQHLAVNEAGDAMLAYQYVGPTSLGVWAVTYVGANSSWSAPTHIVSGGASAAPEAVSVAPNGDAYVLYSFQGNSSGEDCEGVVRAPRSQPHFTVERCVSPVNEEAFGGSIAFLGSDAYFAWRGNPPGEASGVTIQGARWLEGGFLPDVTHNLDQAGPHYGAPTLVDDLQGSVVAFYEHETQLRAAAFDGGPPILLAAGVPASAVAGEPVAFSASFVDLWSGLGGGQPTWSFGDGTAPTGGANVTHTFAAPGVYTITLSAADALGNATSSTYSIAVQPVQVGKAPPPSPPQVTLNTPPCRKLSKRACRRHREAPGAWRTLTGTVLEGSPPRGIASVQVAVYRTQGRHVFSLSGGRFHRTSLTKARVSFVAAQVSGTNWSLKLPRLGPGRYKVLVRATDRAGRASATLTLTARLR